MTGKVGPKGQVVIPKPIRDQLGIRPGDEVVFTPDHSEVHLRRRCAPELYGKYRGLPLLEHLEQEHAAELAREDATVRRGSE